MKQIIALLISIVASSVSVYACRCMQLSFEDELKNAGQVFTGTVIKRTENENAYFLFKITAVYKGDIKDTITIASRIGGQACGVNFETGKTYLVYASGSHTNSCRRNALAANNEDVLKLKFLFDKDFNTGTGQAADPLLTGNEAAYFNEKLQSQRRDFDFNGKKIAFALSGSFISKQEYFAKWGYKDPASILVLLTEKEKISSHGYDAIIVLWRKQGVGKSFRKKLVRKLKSGLS